MTVRVRTRRAAAVVDSLLAGLDVPAVTAAAAAYVLPGERLVVVRPDGVVDSLPVVLVGLALDGGLDELLHPASPGFAGYRHRRLVLVVDGAVEVVRVQGRAPDAWFDDGADMAAPPVLEWRCWSDPAPDLRGMECFIPVAWHLHRRSAALA